MKKKTINAVICKKFDEFTSSITDTEVKKLVRANTVITGGCIASMLLKEDVNDFDLYFTNKETVLAVANYYVNLFNAAKGKTAYILDGAAAKPIYNELDLNLFKGGGAALNMTPDRVKIIIPSVGVAGEQPNEEDEQKNFESHIQPDADEIIFEEIETPPLFQPVFLSGNAITLSGKIQIVIRFYGEPSEIHENYDFVHCTNFWYSKEREVTLRQGALEAILSKDLIYIGSKYPLCSIIRTRKFLKRGWNINAGQYLKMCFQVSKLDLTDINVLEDQLIGVDVAYFTQLICNIQETMLKKKENNEGFKLDYGYLSTIVDKMF